jgi:hypothetical protein
MQCARTRRLTLIVCPLPGNFSYHNNVAQTVRSFEGIYHSNFNETIVCCLQTGRRSHEINSSRQTFCNFKPKDFEV